MNSRIEVYSNQGYSERSEVGYAGDHHLSLYRL